MSRFAGDDEDYPGQWALWEQALTRSVSGKKGQAALRELRAALLELPEPKLIHGRLADEHGCVCVVAAIAVHRRVAAGEERQAVLVELEALVPWDDEAPADEWEAMEQTLNVAGAVGLTRTMAVHLSSENDDYYKVTPEQRYERMLRHVESLILEPVPS